VIRQAISCDICGSEKKQTNHWFVAYEYGAELRVSGWSSRNRLRPGSKHLCGQTCLHKLVDDFMARALSARVQQPLAEEAEAEMQAISTDTSLTADRTDREFESSARLIPTSLPAPPAKPPMRFPVEVVAASARHATGELPAPADEPPRFASRNWRAEAWERERERELHAVERRPENGLRRRFKA
jgi:hypothetical protein